MESASVLSIAGMESRKPKATNDNINSLARCVDQQQPSNIMNLGHRGSRKEKSVVISINATSALLHWKKVMDNKQGT